MLEVKMEAALAAREIPFGLLEVWYPEPEAWRKDDFYALVDRELDVLRAQYAGYDRKAVFGENRYFRFFKKFKKTYPVMMQFESCLFKGRPFPREDPVIGVPFLAELTTGMLSGTHDIDRMEGALTLFSGTEKAPFPGLRGEEAHTYPGDVCGRDEAGIIFSMIAGADDRTCFRSESRHVFYPAFGTPGQPREELTALLDRLQGYVAVLAPTAETRSVLI